MFLFPGGFIKLLLDKFAPKRDKNYTSLMEAALLLSYSFLVLIVNFIIFMLGCLLPIDIINMDAIGAAVFDIEGFGFIFIYVLVSFITCPLISYAWHYINKHTVRWAVNKYNEAKGKLQEAHGDNVFESIFNNDVFDIDFNKEPVISVEKDYKMLIRGRLCMFSGDGAKNREIVVREAEVIESYFARDSMELKNFPGSENIIFKETIAQYCDIENGLVIKIYDMSKFNAYVEEILSSNKDF